MVDAEEVLSTLQQLVLNLHTQHTHTCRGNDYLLWLGLVHSCILTCTDHFVMATGITVLSLNYRANRHYKNTR